MENYAVGGKNYCVKNVNFKNFFHEAGQYTGIKLPVTGKKVYVPNQKGWNLVPVISPLPSQSDHYYIITQCKINRRS